MVRIERMVDDIDGSEDDVQSVRIVVGGDTYDIDLGAANRRKLLGPLLKKARKADVPDRPVIESTSEIRRWANANGYPVGARGGISGEIIDAYRAAMGGGGAGER